MINRRSFRGYQPMNVVYKSKQFGTELWLGDYYAATDFQLLKAKNVKSVLTAAAMLGVSYPSQMQMNHKTFHAFDMPSYKMTPHFQDAFQFIHDGLKNGNVLVHCAAGISRSTTCVLVYMMRTEGFTFNQALQIVRAKRTIVNPNYGFQNQLKKYELKLKKTPKNNVQKSESIDSQKKVVLNFLKQQTPSVPLSTKTIKQKLNATSSFSVQRDQLYSKFMRNQSTNQKPILSNTIGSSNNKLTETNNRLLSINNQRVQPVANTFKNGAQLNYHYLALKLDAPKIVTIKK